MALLPYTEGNLQRVGHHLTPSYFPSPFMPKAQSWGSLSNNVLAYGSGPDIPARSGFSRAVFTRSLLIVPSISMGRQAQDQGTPTIVTSLNLKVS